MISIDKYEGHTEGKWNLTPEGHIVADNMTVICNKYTKRIVETNHKDIQLIADAPLLLEEVKRLREENDLLRSMQKDGIEASAHDRLLLEINRLREDNEKLHDAINRSFHAKISGSALEIYNGWWEGEEE